MYTHMYTHISLSLYIYVYITTREPLERYESLHTIAGGLLFQRLNQHMYYIYIYI